MSLINEALKRAQKTQGRRPVVRSAEPSLQPAGENTAAPKGIGRLLLIAAVPVVVVALGCLNLWGRRSSELSHVGAESHMVDGVDLRSGGGSKRLVELSLAAQSDAHPPKRSDVAGTATSAVFRPVLSLSGTAPHITSVLPVSASASGNASATSAGLIEIAPPPTPPISKPSEGTVKVARELAAAPISPIPMLDAGALQLQAIHYRLKKPSVLINGKLLFVGGEIGGAKVVNIGRESAQVLVQGKTTELRLH